MAGSPRRQHSKWSVHEEDNALFSNTTTETANVLHESLSSSPSPSFRFTLDQAASLESHLQTTLRTSPPMIVERKAYPLPDPSQVENNDRSWKFQGSSDAILHPTWPSIWSKEQERRERDEFDHRSPGFPAVKPVDSYAIDGISENLQKEKVQRSFVSNPSKIEQEMPPQKWTEAKSVTGRDEIVMAPLPRKVVVVYDGEKRFTIAPVDAAINEYATSAGDAIIVVAYLEHVMSPLGMKLVADVEKFSGVNEACLKLAVSQKRDEIVHKLQESCRLQVCQVKKIQLDVKVLAGANPKAVVVREIQVLQGTCTIFDKNAMKDRNYYLEKLPCNIFRLRSDGHSLETVSYNGQDLHKSGSITSDSSSSSDSSFSAELSNSASLWSKLNPFSTRRSTAANIRNQNDHGSSMSRTHLLQESPPTVKQEEQSVDPEIVEESFSFDSPKPKDFEAYVHAAAGFDVYAPYTGDGGRYSYGLAM